MRDGRMTVRLHAGSLRAATRAVSEKTGIEIQFVGEGDRQIEALSFTDIPVEQGLRKILRSTQYAFVFSGGKPDAGITHVLVVLGGDGAGGGTETRRAVAVSPNPLEDTTRLVAEVRATLHKALAEDPATAGAINGDLPRAAMPDGPGTERLDEVVRDLSEQLRTQIQENWTQPAEDTVAPEDP